MQYCTFTLAAMTFGIDVSQVQEAIRHQEMTPVPLAPEVVGGLLNLRGQIVTAIDLRARLGLPARPEGHRPMNVVIRTPEGAVSLLVDQIGDVVDVEPSSVVPVPDTTDALLRHHLLGAGQLPDGLLLVLDTLRVLDPASVPA